MHIRTVFTAFAVLAGLSVISVVFPARMLELYGIAEPSAVDVMLYRLIATLSVGAAFIAWFARDLPASRARAGIAWGFVVLNAGTGVAAALGVAAGLTNAIGWLVVAFFGVFALAFLLAARAEVTAAPAGER